MGRFRFPEGVEFFGDAGADTVRFRVSIPLDEDGFVGRECPACEQHFRMLHEDYAGLPEDLRLWCVYCGHQDDHSDFMTAQQLKRALRAPRDYAIQLAGNALDRSFRRASSARIRYRSRPFFPAPLPEIREERLVRQRTCDECGIRYAVFGEHRFCPVCGLLLPLTIALDALNAEAIRLDALEELSDSTRASVRERGVLDRTYVDTLENIVSAVEVMAEQVFRSGVTDADEVLRGRGKVFQRLNDLAELFATYMNVDPREVLGDDWDPLVEAWAARHVFTHCDGMVDEKYLRDVPTSHLRVGQRLRVTEAEARSTLRRAEALCRVLAGESQ